MLVFIDDSGDPGFKLKKGSTDFFVIAMVVFDDELEAEKTALGIKELRRELKFPENMEFRFFKTRPAIRVKFLKAVRKYDFKIRCLIVEKAVIYSPLLRQDRNSFYGYFIKEALMHSGGEILNAKVRIDGSGDRRFRKNFLGYLRRELAGSDRPVMKNCKLVDSRSNVLIQLADMIAGSINRSCNKEKKDSQDYRDIIKSKITNEWRFI